MPLILKDAGHSLRLATDQSTRYISAVESAGLVDKPLIYFLYEYIGDTFTDDIFIEL